MQQWVRWETAGDLRVCWACRRLDRTVWPLGHGGPVPPLHWRCRCRLVPLGEVPVGAPPPVAWGELPLWSQWLWAALYGVSAVALPAWLLVLIGLFWRWYDDREDDDVPPPPELPPAIEPGRPS